MTQPRKDSLKKRPKENSKQALLPLAQEKSSQKLPNSKVVFQLKTELHRLQQRDREWKLMFNMLSHDLKEPLLTLEGFTKLLDETGLSKDQLRYLKVIREAVNSLHLLVGSLQSIARLSQDPEEFSDVSLRELIQSVITSLSQQIEKSKGVIHFHGSDVLIKGDPVRLYQVFLNLIANSLKYHKKAINPVITISYRKDARFHRISIKDNGVGIDPHDLKKIFLPFTRLEDVPTDGMGIGLSIVKRIAESFRGQVLVRSKQNVGTTFTVCLPRDPGAKS
ncbi:MAG: response regulator receiver sensor signal transduction histidine kinase [Bacteriovoracaceae bacterium]|nr:response regulator receiver sensor signal transduction histidine kinase [Bacteriovoracaceae bacterium]